jgi:hypothetical protein
MGRSSTRTNSADAPFDTAVGPQRGIALGHPRLDGPGAAQSVYGADKLDQQAVAGGLDDATVMHLDSRVDHLDADRLQAGERALLVGADQPRIAGHIGGENGGETALGGHGANQQIRRSTLSDRAIARTSRISAAFFLAVGLGIGLPTGKLRRAQRPIWGKCCPSQAQRIGRV